MSIQDLDPLISSIFGQRHTAHTYFDGPRRKSWNVTLWSQKQKKRYTFEIHLHAHGWRRITWRIQPYPNANDRPDPQIIQGGVNLWNGNPYFPYSNVILFNRIP